jgi:Acetyltransferase (GNAT) domain
VNLALHTRHHARPYAAADRSAWDAFVRAARNGVFLFERAYLDYHAARYQDASLMLFDERGEIAALLPAQREADSVLSHGGLTFGGLVMHPRGGASSVLDLFETVVDTLRAQGARRLVYRPVPHIYHRLPSEDDLYALHRLGARTVRVDLSTTIDLARRPALSKGRRHALAKARRAGVEVRDRAGLASFWRLLDSVLAQRHGTRPTHSLTEMQALVQDLPERIVFCGAWRGDTLLGGAVLYRYDGVLHTQYLACDDEGRDCGALDLVIEHALTHHADACRWLNFGISTSDQGRTLNAGLLAHKEMFGGRSTVLQTLELDLAQGSS